jgi:hypothetical protein
MPESRTRDRDVEPELETAELENIVGYTDTSYGPYEVGAKAESMTDYVTKDYRKKIAAGVIINNPCIYTTSSHSTIGAGYVEHFPNASKHYKITGPVSAHFKTIVSDFYDGMDWSLEDPQARCKLVCLANVDSTPYAFGEDALEVRETLRFLKNPLAALKSISRGFRSTYYANVRLNARGTKLTKYVRNKTLVPSKKEALILAKAHADAWLTYRFAVSPLLRSAADALDAYSTTRPIVPVYQNSHARIVEETTLNSDKVDGTLTYGRNVKRELDGHATIMYQVSNPIYDWKYRLGFRLKDAPTTVWQILPYSFMVDRLLDVTSFSKGVINLADPRVKFLAASYRIKDLTEKTWYLKDRDLAGFTIHSSEKHVYEDFTYTRSVWKPNIFDTIPQFTPKYLVKDATYVADAVTLILSNLRM